MRVRDELLRAAIVAGADAETVVRVHRLSPLVEHAALLGEALMSQAVIDAFFAERSQELIKELIATRRRALLVEARLVALQPTLCGDLPRTSSGGCNSTGPSANGRLR